MDQLSLFPLVGETTLFPVEYPKTSRVSKQLLSSLAGSSQAAWKISSRSVGEWWLQACFFAAVLAVVILALGHAVERSPSAVVRMPQGGVSFLFLLGEGSAASPNHRISEAWLLP